MLPVQCSIEYSVYVLKKGWWWGKGEIKDRRGTTKLRQDDDVAGKRAGGEYYPGHYGRVVSHKTVGEKPQKRRQYNVKWRGGGGEDQQHNGERGRNTYILLALVTEPLTTHPFRHEAP